MSATALAARAALTQGFLREDPEASFEVVVFTFHEWRRKAVSW
jgi:hypothetical protein